jgi:hypothetical protein
MEYQRLAAATTTDMSAGAQSSLRRALELSCLSGDYPLLQVVLGVWLEATPSQRTRRDAHQAENALYSATFCAV